LKRSDVLLLLNIYEKAQIIKHFAD